MSEKERAAGATVRLGSMSFEHAVQRPAKITQADTMVRLTRARDDGTSASSPGREASGRRSSRLPYHHRVPGV